MFAWLRKSPQRVQLAYDLALLSVVTSLALNTTLLVREREIRNRSFRLQREVLTNLRQHLQTNRAATLGRAPEVCRQLVKVGLKPAAYGLDERESATAEADVVPFHRDLSWYDVFFRRRKLDEQHRPQTQLSSEQQWEQGTSPI